MPARTLLVLGLGLASACVRGQAIDSPGGGAPSPARPSDGSAPRPAAPAPVTCVFAGPTVARSHSPRLFSRGDDPSGDPECTALVNPERGFFSFRELRGLRDFGRGRSLVYTKVVLGNYLERELDEALLAELAAGFAAARRAGVKTLPRFYYAEAANQPVAELPRVLAHIAQLGPLLRENADVIAALHAGFIGPWGEWHGDREISARDRKDVLEALLGVLPATRMVLVRRPSFKREAFGGPLTAGEAFAGTPLARLGHLNDCFLASDDDQGTYASAGERGYAVADSQFTAVGGETCALNPPRSECPSALMELARHHWSFVNADYDRAVIESWRRGGCEATIACRLGYRLVVRGHESPAAVKPGAKLTLSIALSNDGFARPFNPRPVELVLAGPRTVTLSTGVDARSFAPGDTTTCLAADLPADLPAGSYRLGLRLADPDPGLRVDPRYAIRFASGSTWDEATGINQLDAMVEVSQ